MTNRCLLSSILLMSALTISAAERVSVDTLMAHWDRYVGQRVQLEEPLTVCGVFYDSLLLSTSRLFVPEEHAQGLDEGDSTRYYELQAANQYRTICLMTRLQPYKIRCGSQIRHLEAQVMGKGRLLTGRTPHISQNHVCDMRPRTKNANLRICSANIQNYFYHLGGYAGAKTQEQFARQTRKTALGLRHMDADIYALCELEKGSEAPRALVEALNRLAHRTQYDFVDFRHRSGDTISVAYIYRKDRVQPYGEPTYAYQDPNSLYHYRMVGIGFRQIKTGEKLVICTNHLRSKRGTPGYSDSIRVTNVDSILTMLTAMGSTNQYEDTDVLLLGDYNCYSWERPLQRLMKAGYEDILMQYASQDYSYNYKGYVGYLDRAFASPSMAAQVVSVQPVHLNADYFYSLGYRKTYDKTMHRYSDHDPLMIGIRLGETPKQP